MKLRAAFACCLGMFAAVVAPAAAVSDRDTVVLLHGLGRTRVSMALIATALERDGYRVINVTYPSRTLPLETLAHDWLPALLRDVAQASPPAPANAAGETLQAGTPALPTPRVHFVTHSMGGIVLRMWLRDRPAPANLGRVVMLAPPNAGSELTDALNIFPPYRWFTGINGRRLGTAPGSVAQALGSWSAAGPELGVIAGDRSLNPLFSACLPGANDGKVTVAATHLAGERAHLVMHHTHTWLGWRRDTIAQVRAFLRDGKWLERGT